MSLINDALKRTRDTSFQAGNARPMTSDTYRVSSAEDKAALGSRSGVWVSLLVLVMAGVAVMVFSLRVVKPSQRVSEAMLINSDVNSTAAKTLDAAAPSAMRRTEPVSVPTVTPRPSRKAEEDQLVDKVVEKLKAEQAAAAKEPPVTPPAPPPAEPVKYVLQGVTSGPGYREAMVNGFVVREGDDLDGARIVSIESRRVKLQLADREILLRLP